MIAALALQLAAAPCLGEGDAYALERYTPPEGAVLEVGGLDFLPDGSLVLSTRRGQVWRVDDPLTASTADARFTMIAEGLDEGLGLSVDGDGLHVVQRGELSRLVDADGDGLTDTVETICDAWGLSGHYHEFAFGLPRDERGNWYVGLNVSFGDPEWWHGRSTVPYRGWVVRVTGEGEMQPFAHGFRSPCGLSIDRRGRVFVTDNQGDWCASSPIYALREGGFYGHPKSLAWTPPYVAKGIVPSDEVPPREAYAGREPAAIWIPYKWSRSTGNLVEITRRGSGALGDLFEGQFVVAELTNGMLLRAGFEEVQGVLQGWVLPLREDIGSVVRVLEAPDGSILCGLTNRGWGGKAPADGLARVRATGRTPFEIRSLRMLDRASEGGPFGFEVELTLPAAEAWIPAVMLEQYDYDYWWEYGSPERHTASLALDDVTLSDDRLRLTVRSHDILPAMVARLSLLDCTAANGAPLLHPEVAYTVNQLPSGAKTNGLVSKIVPPPPSKGAAGEGVLRLSWGDALGQLTGEGWRLVSATLDSADPSRFRTEEGNGALLAESNPSAPLASRGSFGDAHLHLEFMLPRGGDARVYLQGCYGLRLADLRGAGACTDADCAALAGGAGEAGIPPKARAYRGPGEWHELDVWFRAPRFDAAGTKTHDAHFDLVLLDGTTVHEHVDVRSPAEDAPQSAESPRGPLVVRGGASPIAIRNVQVKPLDRPADERDWTRVDVRAGWDEFETSGDGEWEREGGEIIGRGALGHLRLPFDAAAGDFELRFRAKVNENGAGALVLFPEESEDGVTGLPIRINSSFPHGGLTGSIGGVGAPEGAPASLLATELVAADTWVDVHLSARTEAGTTTLIVSLNGVEVNRLAIPAPSGARDALALRVDHDGTVVRFRDLAYLR